MSSQDATRKENQLDDNLLQHPDLGRVLRVQDMQSADGAWFQDTEAHISLAETMGILGTIFKIFIGSGVLFLPKAFSNGGWLFSVIAMLVMAIITNVTMMKLVACRAVMASKERTYGAMGYRVAGARGQLAVNVSVVLSQIGFCCVYVL